ncbi:disease resistance protein RUN1-like [Syzygium oleosum]|uniref:disease resistance protein RUN1-like n=1 Tax=Syzygium oleosum TaxID=219896 RepID=UPI0024BAD8AC|nr:disease resistance protein RUN1-like [Syzygium oleosum]
MNVELGKERSSEELELRKERSSKEGTKLRFLSFYFVTKEKSTLIILNTELYRQTLSKHQKKPCSEAWSWEKALIKVGKIKGWNWNKDESQADLIKSVIEIVLDKLNVGYKRIVSEDLVGVDDHVEAIIKKLDVGSNSVQFLGIHGMGGIGKTTLAKVIFNRLSSHFKDCNFLYDVRELSQRHGPVYLQKELLSKFLDSCSIVDRIHDVDDGIKMIKRVLGNKKVLIVLDDVDEKEQLESLAKEGDWFGSGSRIIITTRDQSVLRIEGEATSEGPTKKSAKVSDYEVEEMEFDHALKLFSRHAFRRDFPPDQYVSLSKEVVSTLGMLPFALEVTGSSLNNEPQEFWEATLKKLKDAPPNKVQSKLMISYDKLDNEQKQVFLDIACFFVNKDKTYPFYMWDACGYHPQVAIKVLFLKSLIKIKDDDTFWMHDQVRDLGRKIVHEENFDNPCKRSRVWNHTGAQRILTQKKGSSKIVALSLGYCQDIILKRDEFAGLQNLRFFQGNGVSLVGDFNNLLSRLRWLSCQFSHPDFETINFHPIDLVVLNLSYSSISEERIGWIRAARKLKVLDLSYCRNLTRTPDLSTLVSLERLILRKCSNLIEINPSIGNLKLLTVLNLDGCDSLRELPKEIGCLQALTEIVMPPMPIEFELPQTFGNLKSLLTFDLSRMGIGKLPCSIGGMVKLRRLNLSMCQNIMDLPDSIWELKSLIELDLSSTGISYLPDSIGNLKQLTILRMRDIVLITKLPSAVWLLEKLEVLDANECWSLTGEIPEDIGRLSCLRILHLLWTEISGLPTTVSRLSNLQELKFCGRYGHRHISELPPSLTCLIWSIDLPTSIGTLSQLKKLTLEAQNVRFLPRLPSSLRELRLRFLKTTQSPDFSNLKNLSTLEFHSCSIPEFSGIIDAELEKLNMEGCTFTGLDKLFELEMKRLTSLTWRWCEFPPKVMDLSRMKNLQEVYLYSCKFLVEIRSLEELGSLSTLGVLYCDSK